MTLDAARILHSFQAFSAGNLDEVRVFFAPGRVNLIGEHTDYNGGHVLPAALELGTVALVRPRSDNQFRFASTMFPDDVSTCSSDVSAPANPGNSFASYPEGVIWSLQRAGVTIRHGADFMFHGNLPSGAGLSSSASLEVVTAYALNAMAGSGLNRKRIAELAQVAEREFVGVDCGIMDQFAVSLGKCGHALLIDCATLDYQPIPFALGDYRMVIAHSNVPRSLVHSAYNERRQQCEAALSVIQQHDDSVASLADIPVGMWPEVAEYLTDSVLRQRARHVVFENERTLEAVRCLEGRALHRFGELMNQSHISLRDDFEVSGQALDVLVEAAWGVKGCIGSRMTGAGFGGCTVSLVAQTELDRFQHEVAQRYAAQTGLVPSFFVSAVGDGVREIAHADLCTPLGGVS